MPRNRSNDKTSSPPGQLEFRKIDSPTPNPRNARTHSPKQISQIAASIRELGFVGAIIINKARVILAGHGRYEAARLLNHKTVPTILLEHLTQEQQRAFMLADNKIAQSAGWDPTILKIEFEELMAGGR